MQAPLELQLKANMPPLIVSPTLTRCRGLKKTFPLLERYHEAIDQKLPPPAMLTPYCSTGWMIARTCAASAPLNRKMSWSVNWRGASGTCHVPDSPLIQLKPQLLVGADAASSTAKPSATSTPPWSRLPDMAGATARPRRS